ncbi:unnamed protein product [Soboliphyme baturini]|uniref:Uncharacterized protein n=1 Tax=Soboliphyme baturini TaxID=241478 RepID=A0A183ITY8_9BILA|nr:unnamed protein product [Soboliphyme baturini]
MITQNDRGYQNQVLNQGDGKGQKGKGKKTRAEAKSSHHSTMPQNWSHSKLSLSQKEQDGAYHGRRQWPLHRTVISVVAVASSANNGCGDSAIVALHNGALVLASFDFWLTTGTWAALERSSAQLGASVRSATSASEQFVHSGSKTQFAVAPCPVVAAAQGPVMEKPTRLKLVYHSIIVAVLVIILTLVVLTYVHCERHQRNVPDGEYSTVPSEATAQPLACPPVSDEITCHG